MASKSSHTVSGRSFYAEKGLFVPLQLRKVLVSLRDRLSGSCSSSRSGATPTRAAQTPSTSPYKGFANRKKGLRLQSLRQLKPQHSTHDLREEIAREFSQIKYFAYCLYCRRPNRRPQNRRPPLPTPGSGRWEGSQASKKAIHRRGAHQGSTIQTVA